MYDLKTYLATKDSPGGPIYIDEKSTAEYQLMDLPFADEASGQPPTLGRVIGGIISLVLLAGTGAYLFLAW